MMVSHKYVAVTPLFDASTYMRTVYVWALCNLVHCMEGEAVDREDLFGGYCSLLYQCGNTCRALDSALIGRRCCSPAAKQPYYF